MDSGPLRSQDHSLRGEGRGLTVIFQTSPPGDMSVMVA